MNRLQTKSALIKEIDPNTKVGQTKRKIVAYCIEHGPSTITDLAHHLMLSAPTVTKFIGDLEEKGCIMSYGKLETHGGRYPYLYGLHPDVGGFVGVYVHHNKLNIGYMDIVGNILKEEYDIPFELQNQPEKLDELASLILGFIERHNLGKDHLLNININLPGRINSRTGYSYTFFSDLQKEASFAEIMSKKLGFFVTIDNDTRGLAYGEYTQGVGVHKNAKDVLYINLSWGLGLGVILNGKVYTGKSGFSGEFGHISIFDNEILCQCGKKGCMQTEIGGHALHREIIERIRSGETSILSNRVLKGEELDLSHIIEAINKGDVLCLEVLASVGRKLGRQLAGLINIFNPELVIIGGSLAATGEILRLPVETIVRTYTLNLVSSDTEIVVAELGEEAGLIGACRIARSRRFE
ncbi:transcriptional regulator [Porphyromonas gingivicanis]|uniref:Transcriptional regulator n=1 Tax=Porphyromonas gingivicanis TaxID=266762 RepID=A0A0A2G957_9PORP|nr:ROK family transcriptional regulator [Porphyromonas gingivicanis]KGN98952.1 transcriptional regulator [Porphyromonas gingivicanis]